MIAQRQTAHVRLSYMARAVSMLIILLSFPAAVSADPKLTVGSTYPCGGSVAVTQPLVYAEFMRLGGPGSAIGCPTGDFTIDGSNSTGVQNFQNGQIAVRPGVWQTGVVAAYQAGNDIRVDWNVAIVGRPSNNYDEFLVRWDFNNDHFKSGDPCSGAGLTGSGDQCQVMADMGGIQAILLHYYEDTHLRTSGNWTMPVKHGDGLYGVLVEGCDVPTIGKSKCRQGWMHPVFVNYRKRKDYAIEYPIELTSFDSARSVAESRAQAFHRTADIVGWAACRKLSYNVYRNEQDDTNTALAKLAYADYFDADHCRGRTIENRPEVFAWLLAQHVESKTGTTVDACPGCRTGEYDVALSGYIPMLFLYGSIMPRNVYAHVLNDLLNKRGGAIDDDLTIGPAPETENHLNMIETSRYLTNDLLFATSHRAEYDNRSNGLKTWWLSRLQGYLRRDFIEYNARPYQEYTMRGLQNLASFSADRDVRTAAIMVMEYVSAKLAVSSNDLRRSVPYRRKALYNSPNLLTWQSDPQSGRMLALAGNVDVLANIFSDPTHAPAYGSGMFLTAALSQYRIPDLTLDVMVERKHRVFYQGFHHAADELYASEPSFLLSAGGHYATYAYKVAGIGKHDDIGNALPTTLMPTGRIASRDDLIRFDGAGDDVERSNMCVAPEFACGLNAVIPNAMLPSGAGCVDQSRADWTFINASPACTNVPPYGMFVAVYKRGDVGLLEAFDTFVNPNISFDEFRGGVISKNGFRVFSRSGTNTYVTTTGRAIDFTIAHDSRIVKIVNGPPVPNFGASFVSGTILEGTPGFVTIRNPYTGQSLVLDDRDASHPVMRTVSITPYAADSCRQGFVWRETTSADRVCVLPATRALGVRQAQTAASRRDPNGGPFGPQTCLQGFVWREAFVGDTVCVPPIERSQAAADNRLALSRRQ